MGTRADFYVGRGESAEWLGSIAWDGYPKGIADAVLGAKSEQDFRTAVEQFMAGREDATTPDMGWPWPWETSHVTDYAYAFGGDAVHASCFGSSWFDPLNEPDDDGEDRKLTDDPVVFPDMSSRKNVQMGGSRSGVIFITA